LDAVFMSWAPAFPTVALGLPASTDAVTQPVELTSPRARVSKPAEERLPPETLIEAGFAGTPRELRPA
jgi:hypothetical protein